jgi:hypothetical protein
MEVSPEHMKAYDIVAAGAERGHKIPFDRALEIVTNPETPMSFGEQQAFEYQQPVALSRSSQSFSPGGHRATGQMRGIRTGEQRGQYAEDLTERYRSQNVAGLTPGGRQSAGAQRLRGILEQDEPGAVLSTPTGRPLRGMSALDPEALAEGREEYAGHTYQTAGTTDPEQLARTVASATSGERMRQMNTLLGPQTSSVMLHLKTESGLKPVAATALRREIGPIASNVFNRAANYYAGQQGIELPDTSHPEYLTAANSVLYGNKNVASQAIPQMAKAFDQELRTRGVKLAATADPRAQDTGAVHTLMGLARGTTSGHLALENFSKMAGRARSQGLIRTESTTVPSYITMRPPGV